MDELGDWAFPESVQPRPEDVRFDLEAALDAVVQVRAEIPEDAFTASILGTERGGNGVVIRADGLVLTIGYLITEAQTVWLTTNRGAVVAGAKGVDDALSDALTSGVKNTAKVIVREVARFYASRGWIDPSRVPK